MGLDHVVADLSKLCGLDVPERLQGKDLSPVLDDPQHEVREAAFCVSPMQKGFLLREGKWAYMQYAEDASKGVELFDMEVDPGQYVNLAGNPAYAKVVARFKKQMTEKLRAVRANDLER